MDPIAARIVIDDEHECSMGDFLDDNAEGLAAEDVSAILALGVGDTYHGGGGASATWTVRRIA